MKFLIKFFLILFIIFCIVIFIWKKPILENLGSRILNTKVEIKSVDFVPYKLAFKLINIKVPKENVFVPGGMLYIIPLRLELYGIKVGNDIDFKRENFMMKIYRKWGWKFDIFLKGVDIKKFDDGFKRGILNGHVNGKYGKKLNFYGLVTINNIVLSDSQDEFFGIPAFDMQEIVKKYKGQIELDFTYNGPASEVKNLTRYKPGQKTARVIKSYLLQTMF